MLDLESAPVGGFTEWFLSLHPSKPRADFPFVQNPWIVEYFNSAFGCRMPLNATTSQMASEFGNTISTQSQSQQPHDNTFSPVGMNHVYSYHGFDYYGENPSGGQYGAPPSSAQQQQQQQQQPPISMSSGGGGTQQQQQQPFCDPRKHYIKRDGFSQDSKLQYVVDSVYAFAHAISRYLK